jgi:hypothetical protein
MAKHRDRTNQLYEKHKVHPDRKKSERHPERKAGA